MSSDIYFLDPIRMAAAVSLTTDEQDEVLAALQKRYGDDEMEMMIQTTRYVIETLGIDRIEAQVERMRRGEVKWPRL